MRPRIRGCASRASATGRGPQCHFGQMTNALPALGVLTPDGELELLNMELSMDCWSGVGQAQGVFADAFPPWPPPQRIAPTPAWLGAAPHEEAQHRSALDCPPAYHGRPLPRLPPTATGEPPSTIVASTPRALSPLLPRREGVRVRELARRGLPPSFFRVQASAAAAARRGAAVTTNDHAEPHNDRRRRRRRRLQQRRGLHRILSRPLVGRPADESPGALRRGSGGAVRRRHIWRAEAAIAIARAGPRGRRRHLLVGRRTPR